MIKSPPPRTSLAVLPAGCSVGYRLSDCFHCLRSSILPVPFAFARTGVLLGLCTMLVVGLCNTYTSTLMLRAAALTGHDSYEGVAYAVGGRAWKASSPAVERLLINTQSLVTLPNASRMQSAFRAPII